MKTHPLAIALLSLAAGAFLPTVSKAVTALTSYTDGDLLLGFREIGSSAVPTDLEVDIGPASQFINASAPFTLTYGVVPGTMTPVTSLNADLTSVFGSGWASNTSTTNLVQFGVFGDTTGISTFGLPKNTLFLSEGELNPGTYAPPLNRYRTFATAVDAGNINSVTTGEYGFNGSISTTNNSQAVSQTNPTNSYASGTPSSGAFGTSYDIEQPASGSATGPTNSVLDLYELQPNTVNNQPGILLGTISLDAAGVATFNPVPEPSPAWLGAASMVWLGFLRRRRLFSPQP